MVYFLTHYFQDPKPQTGDRNKFSPLDSPYAPYSIPAWSTALQAVDQSPSHLVESSKSMQSYGHYIFPDPGLFIHPATAAKLSRGSEFVMLGSCAWQKNHLLLCQISLGAHFCQ